MKTHPSSRSDTNIVTAMTLLHVQAGLESTNGEVKAAAESVLSALVLHLRKQKARLKPEMAGRLALLKQNFDGRRT